VVLAPDLLGFGELGNGDFHGDAYDFGVGVGAYNIWWTANQVGRSLVGICSGDIIRVLRVLQSRDNVDNLRVAAIGIGGLGPALLHAAAFDRSISDLVLVESPVDYAGFVLNRYYRPELVHAVVPGALRDYDLPDLAATLTPRGLLVLDPIDQWGTHVSVEGIRMTYDGAEVQRTPSGESWVDAVADWLGERRW
jgi:hypothetical protein